MAETNRALNQSVDQYQPSPKGSLGGFHLDSHRNSGELLLGSSVKEKSDFDNSYLLTERDVDSSGIYLTTNSATPSPRSLLSQSGVIPSLDGATSARAPRAKYIKHKKTRELERKYRKQANDTKTDFVDYLEFLVQVFKMTQRLDAAGVTL